ncbi:hypothetical protein, partial [Pseudomonas sp. PS01298]|uniref:hypothetical protein n=1 Tax=Pseudomonas sp. PS01298 TaxID=2991434 RepID=UPI00249B7D21
GEAPLKPEYRIYLKDRSGLIGAAAQPNAGQARSPQKTGLLTTKKGLLTRGSAHHNNCCCHKQAHRPREILFEGEPYALSEGLLAE